MKTVYTLKSSGRTPTKGARIDVQIMPIRLLNNLYLLGLADT
jgi:hypothetical protein